MDVLPVNASFLIGAHQSTKCGLHLFRSAGRGDSALSRLAMCGVMEAVVERINSDTLEGKGGEVCCLVIRKDTVLRMKTRSRMSPGWWHGGSEHRQKDALDDLLKPSPKAHQTALRKR